MPLKTLTRCADTEKHELDINNLVYHNETLYSAGDDGKIKAWTPDLKLKSETQAHQCSVYCLATSKDTLYSCSNDGTIKSWTLNPLEPKKTIIEDSQTEFWRITISEGCLFSGDDKGFIRVFKNDVVYGALNIAEPVKDMAMCGTLVFTVKDLDLVITNVKIGGKNLQYGTKKSIMGRAPVTIINDKLFAFTTREAREILMHEISDETHYKQVARITDAHDMIINALCGINWDGDHYLFSGGWDKVVKCWKIKNNGVSKDAETNLNIVINSICDGGTGYVYVGGSDGHILRLESV